MSLVVTEKTLLPVRRDGQIISSGFTTLGGGTGSSVPIGQVYPDAGIALSTGSAWGTSIVNNSANWNTAYGWGDWAATVALKAPIASPTFTGTVTTPSLIVEDLTDGYVPYQKAADDKLSNSNIYFDGTNVGIGTASPDVLLTAKVTAGADVTAAKFINHFVAGGDGLTRLTLGAFTTGYGADIVARTRGANDTRAGLEFIVRNISGTQNTLLTLTHDSQVSIGSTNTTPFKVTYTGVSSWAVQNGNNGTNWWMGVEHNRALGIGRNNANDIYINTNGDIGIGTTSISQKLAVNGEIGIQSGNNLVHYTSTNAHYFNWTPSSETVYSLKYDNTSKVTISSGGTITAVGDVIAYG